MALDDLTETDLTGRWFRENGLPGDVLGTSAPVDGGRPVPLFTGVEEKVSDGEARRAELGAFLRNRRERLSPDQVGLTPNGRRRTPGLRREEVAQLAGVGVTWYTWLEQGRDIRASEQVIDSIARTLQLDPSERQHLLTLAGLSGEAELEAQCYALPPGTQAVLDQLDPMPAVVINARHDMLAYNRAFATLVIDLDTLPRQDRNSIWLLATHPAWRTCLPEWEDGLARCTAQLRSAMAEHLAEPSWRSFIARLAAASPEFVECWDRHEVRGPENRTKTIVREGLGVLRLDYTNFWLGPRLGARMITYSPVDDASAALLLRLAELRAA